MQIINVIPISKGINKETLSYFSAKPFQKGVVVFVPLRKKEVPAIVLSSEDMSNSKIKIRKSDFALKKIENKKTHFLFLPEFISAVSSSAEFFATSSGAILYRFVPKAILDDIKKTKAREIKENKKSISSRSFILQAESKDRFINYKSLIREEFARNSSIFIVLPTVRDCERAEEFLKKGIEQYTFVLHSSLTKKEILLRWKNILKSKHPTLIVATGSFLSLPRADIGTIIIEHESSQTYKQFTRPFADIRILAEFYAKYKKIRLIFGDLPLTIETMWRYNNNELDEFTPPKLRAVGAIKQTIVDMKDKKHQKAGKFEIISDELKNLISETIEKNKNMFVFTARRGLSSSTSCRDCGNPVLCNECKAPVVLHSTTKGNYFICHACGTERSADERCKTCASWKLETLGIGIQLIEKKLKEYFPTKKFFIIDKDHTSTDKKALSVSEKFYSTDGGILIGTKMALPYLKKPVHYSAIATIDSLFSLPEWRVSEKIFSILLKIKEKTEEEMLIQTRKPEQKVFDFVERGNLADFYKDEIKKRKQFGYPPFSIFIKITAIGAPTSVMKEMEYIKKLLEKHNIQIYPSSIKIARGKYAMHGLLKIERNKWPDREIVEILRSLPPYFSVDVDPESIL